MLKKLGSYPRQNGLAIALRELGRIERTLFILDWLQNTSLRRRVHAGLNKGEARNALARAVFFNRLGEIRDRTFEQQRYRASGLNLVTAAVILWVKSHKRTKTATILCCLHKGTRSTTGIFWKHCNSLICGDFVPPIFGGKFPMSLSFSFRAKLQEQNLRPANYKENVA